MLKRYRTPVLLALLLLGIALVVKGVGMYSRPAGFIVAGLLTAAFAVIALGGAKQRG